jgi:hypothetical protein
MVQGVRYGSAGSGGLTLKVPLLFLIAIIVGCYPVVGVAQGGDAAPQTGTLKGKVLDADTGAPIKALVEVLGPSLLKAITLDDGSFAITGVTVGAVTVSVFSRGYRGQDRTKRF